MEAFLSKRNHEVLVGCTQEEELIRTRRWPVNDAKAARRTLTQFEQKPTILFPNELAQKIQQGLKSLGYSPDRPAGLADAVMRLSDFYIKNPAKPTPWHEGWCQAAYLVYFMPLNWWRMSWAVRRGLEVGFFKEADQLIDFGSGLGSASLALQHQGVFFKEILCVEKSKEAILLHRSLVGSSNAIQWQANAPGLDKIFHKSLAVFSYSFTELKDLPEWTKSCHSLMIVEPATQADGRRLLGIRQALINTGWNVAAPCTHQEPCPLLTQSERDWCHDRCQWEKPGWLDAVERLIPIKNGTLPFSYLLLTRSEHRSRATTAARMTGDIQEFKGFAKQLICRGSEREFVAWQKKQYKDGYPNFPRGSLVTLSPSITKKGNELRPEPGDLSFES